jgi:catechol 2,3-dioxygenase-like lactoylglutathione lyase family enzyme
MTLHVMHLAEVSFRVTDLPRAVAFYREVLGLEIVRAYPTMVFLKAGELDSPLGRGGHPQLLVLFDRQVQLDIALTTLDHIAFEIPLEQYPTERQRQQFGLKLTGGFGGAVCLARPARCFRRPGQEYN